MNEIVKKKRGRPFGTKADKTASKLLQFRVQPEQHESYRLAAERQGVALSAWVRGVLDKASRK